MRKVSGYEEGSRGLEMIGITKQEMGEEEEELSKLRAANREKARARQAEKQALRTARRKNEERKLADRAAREELAKLPREFSTAGFGQGHAAGGTRAHREMREICLERLRLRSPPLKLELRARWDEFKKKYARWMGGQL